MIGSEDIAFLERKGWQYEVKEVELGTGRETHVLVHNYPVPDRLQPRLVELLVRIPLGYPEIGLDMFWTIPNVTESATGLMPAQANVLENHGGRMWQRWSRHMNGWRSGIDNLETFFGAIYKELHR